MKTAYFVNLFSAFLANLLFLATITANLVEIETCGVCSRGRWGLLF